MGIEYFGGPRVLNGLSEATQTFSVGTAGTNFAISSSGGTHTFNIPDAGASARGLVTTGTQTFAGAKTFSGAISASNLSGTNTGDQDLSSYLTSATAASTYATIAAGQPVSGTVGQVLTKNSGTNYDSSWSTLVLGDRYLTTSTTSNTLSNTVKSFTIGTGLAYTPTQNITISYNASNHMHGEVLAYDSGTGAMSVDIKHHTGAGTYTAWVVNVGGIAPATVVSWGNIIGTLGLQTDLATALNGKLEVTTAATTYQPLDSDLTAIAALTPTNDDFIQRKAGVWTNRTVAQIKTDLSLTGTNSGDQTITLTGDVTGSGTGSFAATIASGTVTLAKMANMATASLIYRKTAGSGAPEVNTLATLKTDLGLTGTNSGDQTTIVGITGTKAQFDTAVTDGNFLYVGDAPTSHLHGNITNAGAIGSTSGLPIITTTSGVLTVGAFGTTSGTFAAGNDSRITGALSTATAASTYQPLNSNLTAIAGLTSAANKLPYFTGSGTAANADFTSWGRSLAGFASSQTMLTGMGLGQIVTASSDILTLRNGATAQTIQLFTTWTSGTTFECLNIEGKTGANFEIGPMKGSVGGVLRGFTIGGYANESSVITPWLTFTNTGGATFATTLAATGVATFGTTVNCNANVAIGTTLAVTGQSTLSGAVIIDDQLYIRSGSLYFDTYGTHNGMRHRRANGTLATPSEVLLNDLLGFWNVVGYHDGGGGAKAFHTNSSAGVYMYASEDFTPTACGANLRLLTTALGSTALAVRVVVNHDGKVAIGGSNTTPSSLLHLISTTEQLRVGYDTGDYFSTTVSSAGVVTFNAVGSDPSFVFSDAVTFSKLAGQTSAEITSTPSGTTQTITLDNGNHQTLTLTSSTGNVTVTLTVPSNVSSGTIIVKQHASTARDITWAVSAGTFKWMGIEPTWSSDATSAVRIVSWRYNGSVMYLMSTDTAV
jgi:hypothetical protein